MDLTWQQQLTYSPLRYGGTDSNAMDYVQVQVPFPQVRGTRISSVATISFLNVALCKGKGKGKGKDKGRGRVGVRVGVGVGVRLGLRVRVRIRVGVWSGLWISAWIRVEYR